MLPWATSKLPLEASSKAALLLSVLLHPTRAMVASIVVASRIGSPSEVEPMKTSHSLKLRNIMPRIIEPYVLKDVLPLASIQPPNDGRLEQHFELCPIYDFWTCATPPPNSPAKELKCGFTADCRSCRHIVEWFHPGFPFWLPGLSAVYIETDRSEPLIKVF